MMPPLRSASWPLSVSLPPREEKLAATSSSMDRVPRVLAAATVIAWGCWKLPGVPMVLAPGPAFPAAMLITMPGRASRISLSFLCSSSWTTGGTSSSPRDMLRTMGRPAGLATSS